MVLSHVLEQRRSPHRPLTPARVLPRRLRRQMQAILEPDETVVGWMGKAGPHPGSWVRTDRRLMRVARGLPGRAASRREWRLEPAEQLVLDAEHFELRGGTVAGQLLLRVRDESVLVTGVVPAAFAMGVEAALAVEADPWRQRFCAASKAMPV